MNPIVSELLLTLALVAPASNDAHEAVDSEGSTATVDARLSTGSDFGVPSEADRAAHDSLVRGLQYLAARQAGVEDGSFPVSDAREPAPIAVTALASLAFMAGGHLPGRGEHGATVAGSIDYLLAHTDLQPGESYGYIGVGGDALSRMHGHGFATLALAQAFAMSTRTARGKRMERALRAAVHLIERTQGAEGGWFYQPQRTHDHEGSITIALVQALRAARNAGLRVDNKVIARAEGYVERSQAPDGSFRYQLGSERKSLALTAAALSTLNAAGRYGGAIIDDGTRAAHRYLRGEIERDTSQLYTPYYERLYVAQAFWQHLDPSHYKRWAPEEIARVVADQRRDGSWHSEAYGDVYATAMNCLFLALPQGLLPIFQR